MGVVHLPWLATFYFETHHCWQGFWSVLEGILVENHCFLYWEVVTTSWHQSQRHTSLEHHFITIWRISLLSMRPKVFYSCMRVFYYYLITNSRICNIILKCFTHQTWSPWYYYFIWDGWDWNSINKMLPKFVLVVVEAVILFLFLEHSFEVYFSFMLCEAFWWIFVVDWSNFYAFKELVKGIKWRLFPSINN